MQSQFRLTHWPGDVTALSRLMKIQTQDVVHQQLKFNGPDVHCKKGQEKLKSNRGNYLVQSQCPLQEKGQINNVNPLC